MTAILFWWLCGTLFAAAVWGAAANDRRHRFPPQGPAPTTLETNHNKETP